MVKVRQNLVNVVFERPHTSKKPENKVTLYDNQGHKISIPKTLLVRFPFKYVGYPILKTQKKQN